MHVLDDDIKQIEQFLLSTFDKFRLQNGQPCSTGIYCCPWAGWLTANFNIQKSNTKWNCADFEFVEFNVLNLDKWQEEYELEEMAFKIQGVTTILDHNAGDEKLNEYFFSLLEPVAKTVRDKTQVNLLLQFLDSSCIKMF